MGRVRQRVDAPFWSFFSAFDLSQCCSFNLPCTSDMRKPWKLIHLRDELVLATVPRHRSADTGWTGIPGLSEKIIPWKTAPGKRSLPCFLSALVVGSWHRVQFHLGKAELPDNDSFQRRSLAKKIILKITHTILLKKNNLKNYTCKEERSSLSQVLIHCQYKSFLFTRSCWHCKTPK